MHLNLEFYRFEPTNLKAHCFIPIFTLQYLDCYTKMIDIKYTMIWIAQTHCQI